MEAEPDLIKKPSFLARKSFLGQPNYLLLALAAAFLIALIPRGARKAVESNTNKAEDWLPPNYAESIDLRWFRKHFVGEQFALVSWKGCTLGDHEKLDQLKRQLLPSDKALAQAPKGSDLELRAKWFTHVNTGPDVLERLTGPPLSLDYNEAVKRLEGALVGPVKRDTQGNSLGNDSRTTCLIVYLSPDATRDNKTMRAAVEKITHIASTECAIPRESIHMGGPPVDNITIDIEGERTLVRLASLAGLMGFALSYWCFRSVKVTVIVFTIGVLSAGMSLALVFYFGVVEVMFLHADRPRLGTVDAILMSMPAVVYVLGLSGAIHVVNYYRDARREQGLQGAAETAVRHGWWPCTLAAFTTAVGLGSLYTSDILPIKKFGLFTGIAVLCTVALLFTILPVFLHRFPISDALLKKQSGDHQHGHLPDWALRMFGIVVGRNIWTCLFWLVVMGVFAIGFTRIGTSVQLLKLLDPDTDLIHDYAWLEEHLGNLVPMELVLTLPPEKRRTADEHAESDGKQYRMTMLEMLDLTRTIQSRVESFPEISRAMSVATFTPESTNTGIGSADRSGDYAKNKSLEENRQLLLDEDYLKMEETSAAGNETGRELWRVSARVAALGNENNSNGGIDYGQFVNELKAVVDPVLVAYEQRDMLVRALHKIGKQLDGAQLCILYRTRQESAELKPDSQEFVLRDLLLKSGVGGKTGGKQRGVSIYNLSAFDAHEQESEYLDRAISKLGEQDALILVSAGSDPTAKMFAERGLPVIDVTDVPMPEASAAFELPMQDTPRPIRSVYTGMVPLVYKTQRQLLWSLNESIMWATVLITVVMAIVLRSPMAGLIAMIPNVFPIVMVFGALGLLGIKVDIGIMMSASVALGVAVDDTIHFLTWFRRGINLGLGRIQSVMLAYDRCATAMLQTTIIGGLGLVVFATSTFTPTQQFGYLMISMLGAALVGDLLLLPAILSSPLGKFFGGDISEFGSQALASPGAFAAATKQLIDELRVSGKLNEMGGAASETPQPRQLQPAPEVGAAVANDAHAKSDSPASADELREEISLPRIPARRVISDDDRRALAEGPHSALHARLRSLRRDLPRDPYSSS